MVAVLTDPEFADRILRHLTERGLPTSVQARGPPADSQANSLAHSPAG